MNRQLFVIPVFILISAAAFCKGADSLHAKKVTHHFQLLLGNYGTASLLSPGVNPGKPYYVPPGQMSNDNGAVRAFSGQKPKLEPLYSYSAGFDYTADLTGHVGISTGINYFTYGYGVKEEYNGCPLCLMPADANPVNLDRYERKVVFTSSLQIPLHLNIYQQYKRGRLVFSTGPDFYFPVNSFGKETSYPAYAPSLVVQNEFHYHLSALNFFMGASMGYSVGIGFEKTISKKLILELLPVFSLINAVPFDFEGQGKGIYQNYIFNTAFGLSTYFTFTK